MKGLAAVLLLSIAGVFLTEGALAGSNCVKDTVCVEAVREKDFVDFSLKNLKAVDITVTLAINVVNLQPPENLPFTETVSGHGKVNMFRLPIIDAKRKWQYTYHVDWTRGSRYAKHDNSYIYRLPYEKGKFYKVAQACKGKFSHDDNSQYAVDFLMPEGTPVHAARDGIVVETKDRSDKGGPARDYEDLANHVIIRHQDGTTGEYVHLKKGGAAVKEGDSVKRGDLIGYSGNTGFSDSPHLHFGVYKAYDGNRRISFPVKFKSPEGIISCPAVGESYVAE